MVTAACLALLSIYNWTFWRQMVSVGDVPLLAATAVLLFSLLLLFFTLINNKYTLKPLLIIILFIAAVAAFAMDNYGFIVSTQTLQAISETDYQEIHDLLSWKLAAYLLVLAVIPAVIIIKYNYQYPSLKHKTIVVMLCLCMLGSNWLIFGKHYTSTIRNHSMVRYYVNPWRPIYAAIKFAAIRIRNQAPHHTLAILDPTPQRSANSGKPKLVILVVGEADRAQNQFLNGYNRVTNPLLAARGDVLSLTNVSSCGTETSVSLPCMFAAAGRQDFNLQTSRYTENVLDLLQKSQVHVLWRDNDSGCKGVCDRVTVDDFNHAQIAQYCNSFECHDEVLLHQLQDRINQQQGDQLIILHKKGNHGPAYYKRYPDQFKKFTPICASNELSDCSNEQLVNTYDNIILYTDYFLDQVIKLLEQNQSNYRTAMLYVSDHGESLGENGVYLHALPYWLAPKEQTHIPFFVWISPDFAGTNALQAKRAQQLSHDNLFHTLLGMFDVTTQVYDPKLDLLR